MSTTWSSESMMADDSKLFTMLSPMRSSAAELSSTDSTSAWLDPNSQMYLDTELTSMWTQGPPFYSFAPDHASTSRVMDTFDINSHALTQAQSCSSRSRRSDSWPTSSASSPPAEADLRTSRRRAQNRMAQRTYRARKENAIKEHEQRSTQLEKQVSDLKTSNANLEFGIQCLKGQVVELQQSVTWWRNIARESRPGSSSPVLDNMQMMKEEVPQP